MNKEEYVKTVERLSPRSPVLTDTLKAFCGGGTVCLIGELLKNLFISVGTDKQTASSYVCITLIFFAQVLTGLGVYDNIAKHLGAGLFVPITGFANAMVSPAMEYRTEGLVTGLGAKLFTVAGPVLVYGTAASVLAGLIYYFFKAVI